MNGRGAGACRDYHDLIRTIAGYTELVAETVQEWLERVPWSRLPVATVDLGEKAIVLRRMYKLAAEIARSVGAKKQAVILEETAKRLKPRMENPARLPDLLHRIIDALLLLELRMLETSQESEGE